MITRPVFAQVSVKGIVSDNAHHPLEFATIVVKGDSGIVANAMTDSSGYYQFRVLPAITYTMEISHLGGGNYRAPLTIKADTIINISLDNSSRELKEIVIDGRKPFERKADRFIYSPNKSMVAGASGIDIMQHVPMLMFDQRSSSLSIIGKSNTVIYINNKKTQVPAQMLIQYLQALPAENIKNIEIITNPGGEYNAATTGGVININIKKMLDEGWQGSVVAEIQQGPYNKSDLNGFINYRKGKIGLQLMPSFSSNYNYNTSSTQLVYASGQQNDIQNRTYRRYNVYGTGVTLDYDLNAHNSFSYQGWISGVTGKSNSTSYTNYSTTGISTPDSIQKLATRGNDQYVYNFGNLNYHHTFNESGSSYLDANIDYNQFTQRRHNNWGIDDIDTSSGKPISNVGYYKSDLPQHFFNLSERLDLAITLPGEIKFLTGAQYSATSLDNKMHYYTLADNIYVNDASQTEYYKYNEKYIAGFFSLGKSFGKIQTKAGLRLEGTNYTTNARITGEKADSNYINLFPNAVIGYNPNDDNQFSIGYSRKINRPNAELLFPGRTYSSANYFSQNNPFLQPALSGNIEFSYVLKSKYVLNVTYSTIKNDYSSFTQEISEDGVSKLKRTYINYGDVDKLNVVINYHDYIIKDMWELYLTPSLTYSRYKGTSSDVHLELTNYNFDFLVDNYLYISKKKMWTGYLTFGYSSPFKSISGDRLNNRTSLDLSVKKVVKQFSFYLAVYDIFNGGSIQKYDLYRDELLTRNYVNTNVYNRSVQLKVRYSFGNKYLHKNRDRNTANEDLRKRIGG
ncbi:TonB-dependent receptor [Chitinophaga sp.]|uniref:TonB-dependent receptor domain-containing protein n=1 Tax=Chitinophaga sp. TaxID=1869181 RepID=UPI0031E3799C